VHPLRIAPPSPKCALEYCLVHFGQPNMCMEFKTLINENSLAANLLFVNKSAQRKPIADYVLDISRRLRIRSLRRGKFSISVCGKNKEAM